MASRAVRYLIRSVVGVVVVAGLATIGLWSWHAKVLQAPGPHSNDVFVVVESGDGHATIRWHLKRAGVITELFHYDLAKFLAGDSYLPKAGEYLIPAGASLADTLALIHQGKSHQRRLTIIEGMTVAQIVGLLDDVSTLTGEIKATPDEGSLLPETYFFTYGTSRQALLDRMQQKREMELIEAWLDRSADLPLKTPQEAVILASIVELETGDSADRREVAGVFVNRLRTGMRLQSDPTVLYGVDDNTSRPIRKSDLKRRTAWNTYVIKGLPQTAICNPSRESIEAVLQPAKTKNMYFVSDGEGGLLFAKTLDAHNKNVRLFRKRQAAAVQ
ncbi:MAG: endolytic transglycosylase MltG [Alphaproteobacteria bacterium]|jgi:UPF0755 protein